ncbi:MAG: hypothetical protein HYY20_05185, partial [Candidatus Tectomicrobia bacterium]|nr:hypothetical protein [Candidatus Tectomicrobia bacterium]
MSTRNDYQFGGFGTIQVWTNVPLDPLPLFRPFRVGDGGQGTGDRKLDRLSPEQGDFYRVLLRSTAPHLLLRHPGPEEGREHRPYRATAETVEELLTALEWDVYRLLRSRLSPFYLIHAGAVAWGGVGWILYA